MPYRNYYKLPKISEHSKLLGVHRTDYATLEKYLFSGENKNTISSFRSKLNAERENLNTILSTQTVLVSGTNTDLLYGIEEKLDVLCNFYNGLMDAKDVEAQAFVQENGISVHDVQLVGDFRHYWSNG